MENKNNASSRPAVLTAQIIALTKLLKQGIKNGEMLGDVKEIYLRLKDAKKELGEG